MHGFSFAPRFADAVASGVAGDLVAFTRVRVRIVNGAGITVVDRLVDFPSNVSEVPLELTVPLSSGTTSEGEVMDLSLAFINAQGDTVFRGGPLAVNIAPNQSGSQPTPVDVPVVYTGVGANASSVVITSAIDTVIAGQGFSYVAEARDGQGTVIPNTPIAWRVITSGKATLTSSGAGSGTTLATRGEALIVAQLLTGQADTLPLEILPLAQSLALVSGNNQTAALGGALAQPLVVRVDATDGQPMEGVAVTFAVTAGGGSLSQLTDTTDASGLASVTWTTGTALTAQTVTATSTGLTGSPVSFTAVPPALALIFDTGPTSVTVGAPITPAVQVSVRDGQGNVATAFTGNVVIALGAGSPAGVLSGTLTAQAVAGVATFADLSLNLVGSGYSLVATAPALSLTSALSSSFDITAGTPTQLVFTQSPSAAVAGVTIAPALVVEARDALGNLVPTFTDAVTLQFQQGSGSLLGTLTVNAVLGVANFADISITGEDVATALRATATGLTAAVTPNFAVANGPAAKLLFSPANVPPPVFAGQPIGTVTVQALDAFDNFVNEFTGAVTVALGTNPSAATLGGTLTVNAVGGFAEFTGLSVSAPGVGYTFVATSAGLASDETDPFTVDPFAFANVWINSAGGNWSDPANWSLGRTPQASDTVVISAGDTYTVTMDVSDTVAVAIIGSGSSQQTLNLGTRQLRVTESVLISTSGVVEATTGSIVGGALVENFGRIQLTGGTHSFAVENSGRFTLRSNATYSGTLTTTAASVVESLAENGPGGVSANITNGFTNNGLLELRTLDAFYGNQLTVGGTLVNGPGAIIRSVTGFGGKTLAAQLDNQGSVEVNEALTLSRASAVHVNTGTIAVTSANLSINQSGTTPSFTNTGTIAVSSGRQLGVTGGTLNLTGGALEGWSGSFVTTNVTLNFDIASARMPLTLTNTTVPGTFTIPAGDSLILTDGSPTMTLANEGRLVLRGSVVLNGTMTTTTASVVESRAQNGPGSASPTITNGFVNNGVIELRTLDAFYGNALTVGGTLVNAPTGEILSIAGFGGKTLTAQLDNQGLVDVVAALTLSGAGAAHQNSGTIFLSGADLTVTQTGTTPSFTNTGTMTLASGRQLNVTGGTLNLTGGTLEGASGALATSNVVLNFDINSARMPLQLGNTTVPGTFTIPAGDSLVLDGGSPTFTLVNEGRLVLRSSVVLGGSLTTTATSVIESRAQNGPGGASPTIANGFVNTGLIELRTLDAFYGNSLTVGGTLVNAPGAIIRSVTGFGGKTLSAQLDNQGTLQIDEALTLGRASAVHLNSGAIAVASGNLAIAQSGTTPSFTNTGTIAVSPGRQVSVSGGTLNLTGGQLTGWSGSLVTSNVTLNFDVASARMPLELGNTTVPGTFTIPAGDSLIVDGGSPTMTLVIEGRLVLRSNPVLGGTVTTTATSVIENRAQNGPGSVSSSITNGFTNLGVIELRTLDAFYGNSLTVGGTLVNAPSGIILSVSGFGGKTLAAQLDNQGTVQLDEALALSRASAAHVNTGAIQVNGGNLSLSQTGTTPSFSNSGAITLGAGRQFTVTGGTLNLIGGTVSGATGKLSTNSVTLNFDLPSARTELTLASTTIPGTFTVPAGDSLVLTDGSPTFTLVNEGRVVLRGTVVLGGTLTTAIGSVLENRAQNGPGGVSSVVTNGFDNNGTIELRTLDAFYGNSLTVGGTLVNTSLGEIVVVAGFGGKTLAAQVDNQGVIQLDEALSLNRASAAHLNNGSILVAGGNLGITQTGTTPSFTNTGSITLSAGRQLNVNGGTLTLTGGTVEGGSGALITTNVTLNADVASMPVPLTLNSTTVTGVFTISQADSIVLNDGSPIFNLVNEGRLVLRGNVVLNGSLTTTPTSVIESRAQNGPGSVNATIASGFTNNGLLELRTLDAFYGHSLTVGGTLVNAPGGTIRVVTGFGGKTLAAQIDNQGILEVNEALVLSRASAAHVNGGSILVSGGNLTVTQSGTTPSFTNDTDGVFTLSSGRSVTFAGGAVDLRFGSVLGGAGGITSNGTSSFQLNPATFEPRLSITGNAISPSPITIAAGDSLRLNGGSFSPSALTVDGTLILEGVHTLNTSGLTVNTGGLMLVRSSNATAGAALTVTAPFTTNGTVRLTSIDANRPTSLSLGASALTIGATGVLETLAGTGGARTVTTGGIDNSGAMLFGTSTAVSGAIAQRNLMNVSVGATVALQNPITLFTSSVTTNLGTLTLTGGCLIDGTPSLTGFVCP